MSKEFNITGTCIPEEHYMVDISEKLTQIKELIDDEQYFTIYRGHQYGKTTILSQLRRFLIDEYIVIPLSFEGLGQDIFASESAFCHCFLENISRLLAIIYPSKEYAGLWKNEEIKDFDLLSYHIAERCQNEKIVLMIDEVDKVSNYRVFLNFLHMLRDKFLSRSKGYDFTFHSVILVGIYDVITISSPWNIAIPFEIEMSFSAEEIASMLVEYEQDYHTGMDIVDISEEIYHYTSGYPFLVSQICKHIDDKLNRDWTRFGVSEAVKLMVKSPIMPTLFDDLFKNMRNNEALSDFLYDLLLVGEKFSFVQGDEVIATGLRYDFIKVANEEVQIHNKIFEVLMVDYFISKERREKRKVIKNQVEFDVLSGGKFNIELFFEKFNLYYQENYAKRDMAFLEREASFLFLFFLQPYLNGKGKYFLENQSKSGQRMDVIVIYGEEEFVIELKIWKGPKLHEDGKKQLLGYMKQRRVDKGYLLTFDFRQKREQKQEWTKVEGKDILLVQV